VRLFLGSLAVVAGAALVAAGLVHAEPASAAQEVPGHVAHAAQPTNTSPTSTPTSTTSSTTTFTTSSTTKTVTKTVTKTTTKTKCCHEENNNNNDENNNEDHEHEDNNDPWRLPMAR
jgi:hypothetical protein